ncbi:MAG: FAD-dependent oxidoreductase, partial [Gammaproteobacteria bacterium]|nr:FAD-dependent oxidoreductase [Gammaproteobacteria bacterium]
KLAASEWSQLDGLDTDNLTSVFQYYDALTDDKKLTQAVLQDAIKMGADFKPNNKISRIEIDGKYVKVQTNNQKTFSANILINASGPWVNNVLSKVTPAVNTLPVDLVQGTHIVIPRSLSKGIYYVEAADKRVIFAIPWQQHCLIGTTETPFNDLPEKTCPQPEEINYLLTTWNQYFNDKLSTEDILESFSGLRVLPASNGSAFNRTRDTVLHTNNDRNPKIVSIYGGKLTAHRATAEAVMEIVHKQLAGYEKTDTSKLSLES